MPKKREEALARISGSALAGFAEIGVFHPIDTVAKRLMSNQSRIFGSPGSLSRFSAVAFKDSASKGFLAKYANLFSGVSFGLLYKVFQRVYKFGGQPYINDLVDKQWGDWFIRKFGKKHAKTMMFASSGSLIGMGEIMLLPLDVLKIKYQTNPASVRGRGLFKLLFQENIRLYRGTVTTLCRNAPGSFALFGCAAAVKDYFFKLEDYGNATWGQNFFASLAGGVASIVVTNPMDVVKTRIQNRNFENPESGLSIIKNIFFKEGPHAFFKGAITKVSIVGPKLVFSFTIAQSMISYFERAVGIRGKDSSKHGH